VTFTAADVFASASSTLLDPSYRRWTVATMRDYLNDGLRAIINAKPNANTKTVTLTLVAGSLQTIPAAYTVLSRVTRNLTIAHGEVGGPAGAAAIRPLRSRELLDAMIPDWQSNDSLQHDIVKHVIYDLADPRRFYVAPANDGTGKVEAVVGAYPAIIAPAASNPDQASSYAAAVVDLPDLYKNPLVDYVLYRAFSMDSGVQASEARAQKHMAEFQNAISQTAQGEAAMTLGATLQAGG
jgi:hypothetical protein